MQKSAKILFFAILALMVFMCLVWYAAWIEDRRGFLTVSFLDVGQGDSIFIDAPSGRQVLIDGGKGSIVTRRLAEVMPWYDRSLDMVIGTHPDADHIGGLIDVLARYDVAQVMRSSVLDENGSDSKAFLDTVAQEKAHGALETIAERGQRIELGSTGSSQAARAYIEVLFPDRSVPRLETNTGSIVLRLVYGNTSFLLTGDSPKAIEEYLARLDGKSLASNVLKAGHHGSKTASSPVFVGYVDPEYAIYSRGCDNSYGHPSEETIAMFARFEIPTLDTCTEGTITFVSDGATVRRK